MEERDAKLKTSPNPAKSNDANRLSVGDVITGKAGAFD